MPLSGTFLIYLVFLLPLSLLIPTKGRCALLLVASFLFYAFAPWQAMLTLALLGAWTYVVGLVLGALLHRQERTLAMHRADGSWDKAARRQYADAMARRRSWLLALGCGVCVAVLIVFKLTLPARLFGSGWAIPMGLSFVTLSLVGYLCDVAHGQVPCERNPFHFALFVFYFPQMWQGPINRYAELAPHLQSPVRVGGAQATQAMLRVVWGAFKKLVIADTAAVAVATLAARSEEFQGTGIWLLILLYSVQIFGDFTGGMDISLGISALLGVPLYENFDRPFGARSLADYWRRWHRSMGRFFTDHVFYPLSVSRPFQAISQGARRVFGEAIGKRLPLYAATLATWALTGLWHGVAWNFLLWGLCNGVFLLVSQEMRGVRRVLTDKMPCLAASRALGALCCLGTLFTVGLFRTLDVHGNAALTFSLWADALRPVRFAAVFDGATWHSLGLRTAQWVLLGFGVLLMWLVGRATPRQGSEQLPLRARIAARPYLCAVVMALGVAALLIFGHYGLGYEAAQFIYGQF